MLSVPTLSLGSGLRVLISLFWGDNHRAQGELGKARTELSQLCAIKGTFEPGAGLSCSTDTRQEVLQAEPAWAAQHRER